MIGLLAAVVVCPFLPRMREEWARSGGNSKAVANGLATTAQVIEPNVDHLAGGEIARA